MKNHKLFALLLALLLACSSALAAVGVQEDGTSEGTATDINLSTDLDGSMSGGVYTLTLESALNPTSITASGDVLFRTNLYANGRYGAASTVLFSSSTTLQQASIPYALIMKAIGNAAGETTWLPAGTPGQEVMIRVYACGPSGTWVVRPDTAAATPVKSVGFTTLTFNAVGQTANLIYLNDSLGWVVKSVGTTGATAAPTIVAPSLN